MIHHVTRVIPRFAFRDCIAFYEILGFHEADPPPGIAGRAIWLERGDSQVHLMPGDDAAPEAGHFAPDAGHFALVCADYEATLERLRAAGHEVDPRQEHWGSPRSYVRDPARNLVELMAWPPGAHGAPEAEGGASGRE